MNRSIYVIAEAGVNHNGSVETAKKMIDAASDAGADAVKFQTFISERVISRFAPKAEYQKRTTGEGESQLDMVKKLELGFAQHEEIVKYCVLRNIEFLSTPFDNESIDTLVRLGVKKIKIPSGELTNLPYLRKVGALKGKVILSTGMAEMDEIGEALSILIGSGTSKDDIVVLQCNSEYPTPIEHANIKAMLSIRDKFGVKVGYSDHTMGIEVPIAAAALGAEVIEKHFTLDKKMIGPDHMASLEPAELKAMVEAIRNIEKALGTGVKTASPSEIRNRPVARKSIIASRPIKKGEQFTDENLTVKRPGTGVSPMEWDRVLGKSAPRDFKEDTLIEM